jgi:hypothetical protein
MMGMKRHRQGMAALWSRQALPRLAGNPPDIS